MVTNANDSGAGSLRTTVVAAPGGSTITFSPALNGVPITLTTGGVVIDRNLTILGNGPASTIIKRAAAAPNFPVVTVNAAVTVTLDMLTVTGGQAAEGGGILNNGNLTVSRSTVADNRADVGGGIAHRGGSLTVRNTEITDNRATSANARGGGIYDLLGGPVTLTNSSVSANTATGGLGAFGGGVYHQADSGLTISDSTVSGNNATAAGDSSNAGGGGIYVSGQTVSGTVSVANSAVVFNSATHIPVGPGRLWAVGSSSSMFPPTSTAWRSARTPR